MNTRVWASLGSIPSLLFIVVQLLSCVWLFATPWIAACLASCLPMSFTVSQVLLKFYVRWVGDAIQLSHPLSPSSPSAFNLSQHQGLFPVSQLFTSGDQSIGASASIFPMNIQGWFPLGLADLISLLSKGFSRVFSNIIQKHQFFGVQPSLWSNSHIHT